ncbi:MAG: hypothetical protein ACI902_003230, partial [Psychroserpens sp.]
MFVSLLFHLKFRFFKTDFQIPNFVYLPFYCKTTMISKATIDTVFETARV